MCCFAWDIHTFSEGAVLSYFLHLCFRVFVWVCVFAWFLHGFLCFFEVLWRFGSVKPRQQRRHLLGLRSGGEAPRAGLRRGGVHGGRGQASAAAAVGGQLGGKGGQ